MCAARYLYDFSLWHCPEDTGVATVIANLLEKNGYKGYVEQRDTAAGLQAIPATTDVIQSSRVSFILLSHHSFANPWYKWVSDCSVINSIETTAKVIPVYVDIKEEQRPSSLKILTSLNYNNKYFKKKLLDSVKPRMHR
uniref:TIR domain-containing protein n=1 Tax=Leptobrachium leishanense TaxID=445787 RepID=A0A8C5LRX8_9ANUR